jgi:hypothetical protein
VHWAAQHQGLLTAPRPPLEPAERVAIRSRHVHTGKPCTMVFQDAHSGAIRQGELPGVFCPGLRVTRRVRLPDAYAVPRSHESLIEILRRHGFASQTAGAPTVVTVECYRQRPGRRLAVDRVRQQRALAEEVLFPMTQDGGQALAIYLEPRSRYGLHRYQDLNLTWLPDSLYPVVRVLGIDRQAASSLPRHGQPL